MDWLGEPWSDDLLRHNDVQAARGAPRISAGNTRTRDPITPELAGRWADALQSTEGEVLEARTGALAAFFGYDPVRPGAAGVLVPPGSGAGRRLLSGEALAQRQRGPDAVSLDAAEEAVIMPEMSAAELAKRLQQTEATLARIRTRRAVRWSNALQRARRRVAGLPVEVASAAASAARKAGRPRRASVNDET